jgi:hypothetical protein
MEANSRKRLRWRHWCVVGALTLAITCIGILLLACMRLPDDRLSWEADDSTPTPTVTPWIRISPTPTRTPVAEETPAPYRRPAEASINLSPSATKLKVSQTLTVTVRLVNGETSEAKLGWLLYRLRMEPNLLAIESDEAVKHTLTLEPGDWDRAEFVLRAVEPGRVTLSGWASYEMHALDYSWGSNSGCYSREREIAITP